MKPAWSRFEEHKGSKYLELHKTGAGEVAQGALPVNTKSFVFETSVFKGEAILRLPCEATAKYFEGKNRKSSILIQGKFKEEIGFRDVLTGQEFCHPIKSPGYLITRAALAFFKAISPSLEANIVAENEKEMIPNATHFMSPMAGTASIINVSDEKKAPKLNSTVRIVEDLSRLGGHFADSLREIPDMEKRIVSRRKYFQKIKNLDKYSFDTKHVWTFDFYNDKLLMDDLKLAIMGRKFDLTRYLAGQPLRIMSKVRGEENLYLWNFELWHERQTESWEETDGDIHKVVVDGTPPPSNRGSRASDSKLEEEKRASSTLNSGRPSRAAKKK
eukprot:CAMPEP_0197528650 /NCGR_PEP_ID=MMETSP1318-20131121/25909_1 /TAXON_ID=552666 /ORGANISM="Partenskyella glossopodia, Strain RCC365" /LENGTH=329 /DNA_ID=CAMNT_0043083839 /DNA_START=186 /DNA_END=1175 /DNA_ORIENTATION=-